MQSFTWVLHLGSTMSAACVVCCVASWTMIMALLMFFFYCIILLSCCLHIVLSYWQIRDDNCLADKMWCLILSASSQRMRDSNTWHHEKHHIQVSKWHTSSGLGGEACNHIQICLDNSQVQRSPGNHHISMKEAPLDGRLLARATSS